MLHCCCYCCICMLHATLRKDAEKYICIIFELLIKRNMPKKNSPKYKSKLASGRREKVPQAVAGLEKVFDESSHPLKRNSTNFLSCFPFLHVTITKSTHCLQSQKAGGLSLLDPVLLTVVPIYIVARAQRGGGLAPPLVCTLFCAGKRLELMTAMFIQRISQDVTLTSICST